MPGFPIVDSHVHLYEPTRLSYPWMAGNAVLEQPSLMPRLDAASAGVAIAQVVFVEVAVEAGRHLDEAAAIQALADADPRIGAMVAHAPVERGAAVEDDLQRLLAWRCLRGVRRLIQGEVDPGMCLTPDFLEGVRRVGRHGLVFDICVKHWALVFALELVRRCPDVTFVLDHIGKPGIALELREPWWGQMRLLAGLPNVVCKLSGVATEAGRAWTESDLAPYIAHALDCFGPDRVMFGSDFPVSELSLGYAEWVGIVDRALAGCTQAQCRAVFSGTARRVYRMDDISAGIS